MFLGRLCDVCYKSSVNDETRSVLLGVGSTVPLALVTGDRIDCFCASETFLGGVLPDGSCSIGACEVFLSELVMQSNDELRS